MTRERKSMLFAVAIAAATLSSAHAGEVVGRVECNKAASLCYLKGLALKGEIDDAAPGKLRRLLDELDTKGLPIADRGNMQIKLDSPGGSVSAAITIGKLLRTYRMAAVIEPNTTCASACVLVYAGAVVRLATNKTALIGIHQPYFTVPSERIEPATVRDAYTTMLTSIRSYFTEMNVSQQLADEMLRTAPSSVRYLSAEEQEKFGLSVVDPIELETRSLAEAQILGLDRREYNRREALSTGNCPVDANFQSCRQSVMKSGDAPLVDFSQFGEPVD